MALSQELKAQWVAALRSGEYPQGNLVLKSDDGEYCCLGVLCDVYDPTGWPEGKGTYMYGVNFHISVLPSGMAVDLGLPGEWPETGEIELPGELTTQRGDSKVVYLTQLNDEGFTFDQIADLIDYFL